MNAIYSGQCVCVFRSRWNVQPGMLQTPVAGETFGIRGNMIDEVEVFPFVTQAYGTSDGCTPGGHDGHG